MKDPAATVTEPEQTLLEPVDAEHTSEDALIEDGLAPTRSVTLTVAAWVGAE
jgi:hypothetical protein